MEFSNTFKDDKGREWTLEFSVASAKRMSDYAGVSLQQLIPQMDEKNASKEPDLSHLSAFLSDPFKVFDAVYSLVKAQAESRGIDKDTLAESIGFLAGRDMSLALLKAASDFFHWDAARKSVLRRVAMMGEKIISAAAKRIDKELDKIDIETMIADAVVPTSESSTPKPSKNSAGDTQATSALTPTL